MKLSNDNKRMTVCDNPELSLAKGPREVFEHWEEGFDAQGAGVPIHHCPHTQRGRHKVATEWRRGWLSGAAVDRIKAGWLPSDLNHISDAIQNH